MPYIVQSSEKLRKTAADFETKAMLYLLNYRQDSSEIYYFVVDFFNDITGMDRMARKLWDVQSKASKSVSAKAIGRELVTLYKNYISDFDFYSYILFLGAVPDSFRVDTKRTVFQSDNINEKSLKSILSGLKEECHKKTYINDDQITDEALNRFVKAVWFVIDDKDPIEYIKEIIKNHPQIIPGDSELLAIFNEIRNKQSEKKNTFVEGIRIDNIDEVLAYGRHLTTSEIRLLVLQRLINSDPLSKGTPTPFLDVVSKYPTERQQELVEECKSSLCRALFDISAAQGFWELFEQIYTLVMKNQDQNIDYIFRHVDGEIIDRCPDFDVLSLKFFIAKIKEGLLS